MDKKTLETLVDAARVTTEGRCFYLRMSRDAREFMDAALKSREEGQRVTVRGIRKVLLETFDVSIGDSAVYRHANGGCPCVKKK